MRILLATLVEERPEPLDSPSLVPMLVRIARAMTDARLEEGAGQGGGVTASP